MSQNQTLCLCLMLILSIFFVYNAKRNTPKPQPKPPRPPEIYIEGDIPPLSEEEFEQLKEDLKQKAAEPEWTNWPKVRSVNNLGKVLSDIDSHMPAGHIYRDSNKVTWAHETTHGINSNIRNSVRDGRRVNGFYVLEDRAAVIEEPRTTIRRVASRVPQDLRGPSFNLYLVQQAGSWNDTPLYLFDEWTAYTNGSECGRELNASGWYYELLQAHNFNVYCMYLAMEVKETCPDYDDKQFKAYIMWNVERTFRLAKAYDAAQALQLPPERPELVKAEEILYGRRGVSCEHPGPPDGLRWDDSKKKLVGLYGDDSDPTASALAYSEKVKTSSSAEGLRKFARGYFGVDWCQRTYGF